MRVDIIQQPPYNQGSHQKGEVEAKGHSQTDGETILWELHSIPRCNKETPSVSERGSLVLLSPSLQYHHKHMQKLGQQSCISYLSSLLDCGTWELKGNEESQQTATEPHLPKLSRKWVVVFVKGVGKANHSHSTPHSYLPPNKDRTRAFPITSGWSRCLAALRREPRDSQASSGSDPSVCRRLQERSFPSSL